ncbi:MAG: hypothetical protein IPN97_12775 [Saprospiraceae bacterium]|nr:hypothetical protein [Saprospiraceae bacterium]
MINEDSEKIINKLIIQPQLTREEISNKNRFLRHCADSILADTNSVTLLRGLIKDTLISKYGLSSYCNEYINLEVEKLSEENFKIKLLELLNKASSDDML